MLKNVQTGRSAKCNLFTFPLSEPLQGLSFEYTREELAKSMAN